MHGGPYDIPPLTRQTNSGRHNHSTTARFEHEDLINPFASGAFRWVAKGIYTSGEREGQACVAKWFKTGPVFANDYFTLDIKAVDKALEIVTLFNELGVISKPVMINVPQVRTFTQDSSPAWVGQKVLLEPFIHNYEKFNSNTGWVSDGEAWGQVMQAPSHFSYHVSRGNYVLCDLQGGVYNVAVVLTDPVILSRHREYGVTDLGPEGISSFFSQHTCNRYCRAHWHRPANQNQYYLPQEGSLMIERNVPTRASRPMAIGAVRMFGAHLYD